MSALTEQAMKTIALMNEVEQQLRGHSTPEFSSKLAQAKSGNQAQLVAPSAAQKALPTPKGNTDEWAEF